MFDIEVHLYKNSPLQVGRVRDQLTVLVDGEIQTKEPILTSNQLLTEFGYWTKELRN